MQIDSECRTVDRAGWEDGVWLLQVCAECMIVCE